MQAFLGSFWTRRLIMLMVVIMGLVGVIPQVDAGFIPNGQSSYNRQADMETVQTVLEQKLVRERLAALGYSPEEIQARLNLLPNEDLHRLSAQIDSLAPAGNGLGFVIGILVIVILILVILQLSNKRVVIS